MPRSRTIFKRTGDCTFVWLVRCVVRYHDNWLGILCITYESLLHQKVYWLFCLSLIQSSAIAWFDSLIFLCYSRPPSAPLQQNNPISIASRGEVKNGSDVASTRDDVSLCAGVQASDIWTCLSIVDVWIDWLKADVQWTMVHPIRTQDQLYPMTG